MNLDEATDAQGVEVDKEEVAHRLEAVAGPLDDTLRAAVEIDADFVAAYLDLVEVPGREWRLGVLGIQVGDTRLSGVPAMAEWYR